MAMLVAYNHRLGSVPLEDLFLGFQFSELRTIYVRLREGPLERQDVAMSVRVCKVDRFVELIREPQLVSDGYVTAVCLGEVALPEDGQECSSLIGRHDHVVGQDQGSGAVCCRESCSGWKPAACSQVGGCRQISSRDEGFAAWSFDSDRKPCV